MSAVASTLDCRGPFVIGGLGGSATRVYAALLQHAGLHMGGYLNSARDNLFVTLLLKRRYELLEDRRLALRALGLLEKKLARGGRMTLAEHAMLWRVARDVSLRGHSYQGHGRGWWAWQAALRVARSRPPQLEGSRGWGFKEPNTHVFLEALAERFEGVRFMYVVRHGLDMAFSGNVAQLHAWGGHFGVALPRDAEELPRAQLDYWIAATERAIETGTRLLGERFVVMRYDEFTTDPRPQLERLGAWLDVDPACFDDPVALEWARPSSSQGRYKDRGLEGFTSDQLRRVEALGFTVEGPGHGAL